MILLIVPIVAIEGVAMLVVPGAITPGSAQQQGVAAFVSLVAILVTPLISCLLIVAYYDLRVRKEGFDLEVLASSLPSA